MTAEATPKGAWTITGLLFLYMPVNFADKAVVGLVAVPLASRSYWRSYLTTRRTRPQSPGCTT
jgi:hypothetical protein